MKLVNHSAVKVDPPKLCVLPGEGAAAEAVLSSMKVLETLDLPIETDLLDVKTMSNEDMMMGGHVPVAPYATFGTEQLAENIREKLSDKADSILLQNHGLVTTGKNLSAAYEKAVQLEFSCKIYLIASSCGKPRILSEEEMQDCAERRKELFAYRAAFKPVDKLKEYVGD